MAGRGRAQGVYVVVCPRCNNSTEVASKAGGYCNSCGNRITKEFMLETLITRAEKLRCRRRRESKKCK